MGQGRSMPPWRGASSHTLVQAQASGTSDSTGSCYSHCFLYQLLQLILEIGNGSSERLKHLLCKIPRLEEPGAQLLMETTPVVVVLRSSAWTLEPHCLLAAWPLGHVLHLSGLSFSICKIGIKVAPAS